MTLTRTRFTVTFTKQSKDDPVGFHLTKRNLDGSIVVASSRENTGLSKGDEIIFINGVRVKPLLGEQAFDLLERAEGEVTVVAEAKRPLDVRNVSGRRGNDAAPGIDGRSGSDGNGSHGMPGEDATIAVVGSDACNIKIKLGSLTQGPDDAKFDFHNSKVILRAIGGDGGNGAKGGDGGSGGRGRRGRNATRHSSGSNGGRGGDGGNAGHGSSGANAGNGGLVELYVTTNETYLLMSVEDLQNPTSIIHKGTGGQPGKHGFPGSAGYGGAGGSSYTWTTTDGDGRTQHHRNSGGSSGPRGKNGVLATSRLHSGRDGSHGCLVIYEQTGKYGDCLLGQYSSRYDLKLAGFALSAEHKIEKTVFQFGDTVTVSDIQAQNTGGMATPTYPIFFEVVAQSLIHPIADKRACVNESVDISCIGSALGSLSYHIPIPSLPKGGGIDFDPLVQSVDMELDAFQEGPPGSDYRRSYDNFDQTGTLLSFRFPVENPLGFISLASLIAGETMKVRLPLRNLFSQDIGYDTLSKRQFMVQFRRLESHIYDMSVSNAKLEMGGILCEDLDSVDEIWWGTVISIPNVPGRSQIDLEGNLRISEQARPYSRLRVQAGLMLQDLPLNMENPSFSLTQLRKLDIVAEPSYERKANNQCILVTSSSTREDVFNHWKFLLEESLGLEVEYLPVSVYGSLDPNFVLPSGQKVQDAFDEKLIIVFDYIFNPSHDGINEMRPSSMLPNGCMPQTSGYKSSTRWLFVGTDWRSLEAELACHYTAPPNDITTHDSMNSFKKKLVREQIFQERLYGTASHTSETISSEVVHIRRRAKSCSPAKALDILNKEAESFAKFIRPRDKLRQYIVETKVDLQQLDSRSLKIGEIIIRRGYTRSMNSAGVIRKPGDVVNRGTMFSIFRNMPIKTRIQRFCYHLGKDDKEVVAVILDSFGMEFLWEVANYIHGQYKHSPRFDDNFPVVTSFFANSDVSALLEAKPTSEVSWAFNDLFACFECVANSKDLRPRSFPFSRLRSVRNHLVALVKSLEQHWKALIDQKTISTYKTRLKDSVRSYLSQDRKIFFYRCNNRWREGLRFALAGKSEYVESRAEPLMNCQTQSKKFEFNNRAKIFKPDVQILTSHDCEVLMTVAQTRNALSAELLQAIRGARADRILEEEESDIAVGPCDSIRIRFSERSLSAVPPVPVAATAPVEPDIAIGPLHFEGTAPS